MTQLRIASINIERSNHLPRVEGFLKFHQPDVLCIQELCERDIPFFENLMGNKVHYVPMTRHAAEVEMEPIGLGLVGWTDLSDVTVTHYHGKAGPVQDLRYVTEDDYTYADNDSVANALLAATCQGFRIATTHLNVTRDGISSPSQLASTTQLIKAAKAEAERAGGLLMAGDFNAPRGRETFSLLAKSFIDGIPPHYDTSLDKVLHRAGHLPQRMVDGFFHTPSYKVADVALHSGVSDHCAVLGILSKAEI